MSAKRILVLTNRVPYPLNDGGNLAMKAMIEGYVKRGWQVYLLSMNTSRHYIKESTLNTIYQNVYQFDTVDVNNDVNVKQLVENFVFSRQPNHAERFANKEFRERLKEVLEAFSPHVVQLESIFLATYIDDINRCSNALTILRLHNIEYQIWTRLAREQTNPLKKYYLANLAKRIKRFEEWAWQEFDLLLPITEVDATIVERIVSKEKIHTSPYGIDLSTIVTNITEEKWVGYHIGAMDWQPNVEGVKWFIETVWPSVRGDSASFEFYFAGRNMPEYFYDKKVEGVHCEGTVPDANTFIADKKILIVPIHSGGGIRIKILEAMALGKIVISTAVGMQGVDAEEGVHYLLANNAEEFADAIAWCLNNKEKGNEIGEKAKSLIKEKYTAAAIMASIDEKILPLITMG